MQPLRAPPGHNRQAHWIGCFTIKRQARTLLEEGEAIEPAMLTVFYVARLIFQYALVYLGQTQEQTLLQKRS